MVTEAAVLVRAHEIVESGWVQGCYARNSSGVGTSTNDPDADGWCGIGAVHQANDELGGSKANFMRALGILAQQAGCINFSIWNDHPGRTHSEVKEIFRRAVASQGVEAGRLVLA